MDINLQVWYKEDKEEDWKENVCFSSIFYSDLPEKLFVKFNNRLDKANLNVTTKEWLDTFIIPDVEYSFLIEEDYYYLTINNVNKLSKSRLKALLTLLRYPGEYYNVCYVWKTINDIVKDDWTSLYLAHCGNLHPYPLYTYYHYHRGHSFFYSSTPSKIDKESIFSRLDYSLTLWEATMEGLHFIHQTCFTEQQLKEFSNNE